MTVNLRPYQQAGVADIRSAFAARNRAVLYVLPTGGGKTYTFVYIGSEAGKKGNPVLILEHRKELIRQASMSLASLGVFHQVVAPPDKIAAIRRAHVEKFGRPYINRTANIAVASVQTLARRFVWLDQFHPKLIVVDECFPAGTMIDGKAIESIAPGDMVSSVNHRTGSIERCPVVRLFKSRPIAICTVTLSSGQRITCTPRHPFFVIGRGYVEAEKLGAGDQLFSLRRVREAGADIEQIPPGQTEVYRMDLLQPGLREGLRFKSLIGDYGQNEPEVCIKAHEGSEPDEGRRMQTEDGPNAERNRPQAEREGRKRKGYDKSSINDAGQAAGVRARSSNRVCGENPERQKLRMARSLQNRHSDSGKDDCNRNRRGQPLYTGAEEVRQAQGSVFDIPWVVSVEIQEPGGDGKFGGLLSDGYVYNIEVEGNHNYFADGTLVHNCHHAVAGTWARVLEQANYARVLGVTATPARTDGQGLGSEFGGCFDAMVHGPTMRELIEMGNLVPPRVFSPPPRFDTSNLHHQGGDYKKDELAAATDDRSITGDAVDHYRRIAPGRPAIVFCVNVQHAEHVAEQFRESGFRFEILIGDMDDALRDERIRMLADGRLQGLVTVDVISEGTDIPVAEVAIMLRATESLVLFLQQAGRVLRPCPEMGKTHGIILDHVGNVGQFVDGQFRVKHGMPDADRDWSLEGKPKRAGKKKDEEPDLDILQCPKCYGVDYPRKVCGLPLPGGGTCDHVFEARQMKPIQQTDGELREITEDEAERLRQEQRRQQGAARTLEQLQAAGMGRKQAEHVLKAREEKAQLRNDLTALLKTYRDRIGDPVTNLGIGQVDVGRMKPKALRESIELVSDAIFQAPRQERLTG